MITQGKFQIGKNKLTKGVINSLNLALKKHDQIRISVLKNSIRDKKELNDLAEEIINEIDYICRKRIIGFTIIIKKQSNKRKSNG